MTVAVTVTAESGVRVHVGAGAAGAAEACHRDMGSGRARRTASGASVKLRKKKNKPKKTLVSANDNSNIDQSLKIKVAVKSLPDISKKIKQSVEKGKITSEGNQQKNLKQEPFPGKPKKKNELTKTNGFQISSITDVDLEQLDETIIANKKKKIYSNEQKNSFENNLFSIKNNKKIKENNVFKMTETIVTPHKNEKISKTIAQSEVITKTTQNRNMNNSKTTARSKIISTKTQKTPASIKKPKTLKKERTKQLFKTLLSDELERTSLKSNGSALHKRMLERLRAAQFRYLNEKLYLSEGKDAKELFKSDPNSFKIYHDGFRQQVKKWPVNPLDIIIKQLEKMPKETKVADMGCGEGVLAKSVAQQVRSFDLVSCVEGVEECDMAHTPLLTSEMDVAVYCLALMGTNLKEYLLEANRILKVGGLMKIAEVESRFRDINVFIKGVECYGFRLIRMDDSRKVFYFMDFKKQRDLGSKRNKLPQITLEPCLYKKR